MPRCLHTILLLLLLSIVLSSAAQVSNLRNKTISAKGAFVFDSLSVVPNTFFVQNVDTSFYSVDFINAVIQWKKNPKKDSVAIIYRVFPSRFNLVARRFSFDSIRNNFIAEKRRSSSTQNDNALFNFGKLTYNGSFGRSLSVGNTQDAVFNSQLNLQINGIIGDSIEIAAAITDNNIPIQPDGTTQQLNEFDKILLQFKKRGWEVDLGDIDLRRNNAYFLKFYQRLQGISYQQKINITKNTSDNLLVSGAIEKGKFARNVLAVQEGNQGPYRLQGNNNELYFVVLAGTEKVFIDGVQMQRGEDADYIINYNTAEVTFTPKQMITKDRRVQVEFQYADRNFLNSMLYGSNTITGKKLSVNVSAYSNVDAKNSPINQTLDVNQKQFLANLGDSIQNAYYPVAGTDSFSTTKILYKRIDTLVNGTHDSVYVYSSNADSAKYNLSFVEAGNNKGNYVLSASAANGKVYQWVAPQNGVPQGFYEAAAFLVTPKSQQVISINGEYKLNEKTTVYAEVASSKYDVNTFSELEKNNDVGFAAKFNLIKKESWKTNKNKPLFFTGTAGYEWVDKNFRPVERLRAVEFTRDWGLPIVTNYATEQLPTVNLQLNDDKNNTIQYNFSSYLRSDGYKGYRNIITQSQNIKGFQVNDVFNLTNINLPQDKGFYLRPSVDVSKTLYNMKNYVAGASYSLEHNEIKNMASDTVTPVSFAFETWSAYIKSNQTKANKWSFTYFTRSNQLPNGKFLAQTDRSHNYNFQTELLRNQHHNFRLNVTYRQLMVSNSKLINQTSDNSLLGRAEYSINEWNGFISGNAVYEIGSGQEQKRDYSYIQVPAGLGQYTWIDYNKDGIAQLNEFVPAQFSDQATYIRIFTPTNQYIKANYNQFIYSFSINPKAVSSKIRNKFFKVFITRWYWQSSLQMGQKQTANGNPLYNPFAHSISDSSLLSLNSSISNTLAFNRSSPVWGADVTQLSNYNKALLTYGFQSRRLHQFNSKAHVNIAKVYTIEMAQSIGTNSLLTPAFSNENYFINIYSLQPKLSYTAGTKFRVQGSYAFQKQNNKPQYGGEISASNAFIFESRYNAVSNTSLTAKFTINNITYAGAQNTTTSYIMLGGLLPGKNYLWNVSFTKRLINNIEINFEYEGRKPGDTHTINTGRASVRALL